MMTFKMFVESKFSHSGEGFKGTVDAEPWRGPHEGKELEMMHAGVKPVALVRNDKYQKDFKQHVDSGKFLSRPMNFGDGHELHHIVGLKGQEHRMNKLHQEFSKPGRNHAKIGRLLGYTKEHIRTWMDSQKR